MCAVDSTELYRKENRYSLTYVATSVRARPLLRITLRLGKENFITTLHNRFALELPHLDPKSLNQH